MYYDYIAILLIRAAANLLKYLLIKLIEEIRNTN